MLLYLICIYFFLIQDNSFEFEKRRNEPVKYQRELWNKTGESCQKKNKRVTVRSELLLYMKMFSGDYVEQLLSLMIVLGNYQSHDQILRCGAVMNGYGVLLDFILFIYFQKLFRKPGVALLYVELLSLKKPWLFSRILRGSQYKPLYTNAIVCSHSFCFSLFHK